MLDRKYIGHTFEPLTVTVELGRLKFFAKAIGEEDPIYFDVDAARRAGHRSVLAPPTFPVVLDSEYPSASMPEIELLGMDIGRVLHASQGFDYFAPIYAGDEITARRTIKDIFDKKGGALEFVDVDSEYRNQSDELVAAARLSIVYKN